MRKFKCESDFMRESTRIYRAYVEKEKQLNDLIAETNSLKDLTNEAKERETKKIQHEISEKRAGMKTLLQIFSALSQYTLAVRTSHMIRSCSKRTRQLASPTLLPVSPL